MPTTRLEQQMQFIREIDDLKSIERRTILRNNPRWENSAEHSWHVAISVWLLAEHSNDPIDRDKVIKMMLIHDIVEIDAGDTFVYDNSGMAEKEAKELAAAERLFNILPQDQATELRKIWDEFEAGETAEAKFAGSVDRLLPVTHNHDTGGKSWVDHNVTKSQVIERNQTINDGSNRLWHFAKGLIDNTAKKVGLRD